MPKTVLIGLDGATFTVLDALMASGVMPFLSDFMAGGVRATLESIVPPLTPPAWTSMVTGKHPGGHGVFDFFQKEEVDSRLFRFTGSHDVQSATVWTLASDYGLKVTALNFPLTFPPPEVNGCVVPGGWMPWKQLRLGCHPSTLFDRLKALPTFNARELALDMTLEEKALEGCAAEEYADWIRLHVRRERRWTDVMLYLMKEEPSDLTAVVFDGVDKLQHLCWRFLDPAFRRAEPSAWEVEVRLLCEGYFRQLDGLIAEIVAALGHDATVILASDHGFGPSSDVVFLNTWLEREGYLAWADGVGPGGPETAFRVGIGQMARHVFEMDWNRTIAYAATPSSQGIHLVRQTEEGGPGIPADQYGSVRDGLVAALRAFRHPETGRRVVDRIWTREEVFDGPFRELGPDLTVSFVDDAVVSILRADTTVKSRNQAVGTHRPGGIVVARGPEIRKGVAVDPISIMDIAPMLLHCLGVPIPDDMTGRLPTAAFESSALSRRPPQFVGSLPTLAAMPSDDASAWTVLNENDEALVLKRLAALGYIE